MLNTHKTEMIALGVDPTAIITAIFAPKTSPRAPVPPSTALRQLKSMGKTTSGNRTRN